MNPAATFSGLLLGSAAPSRWICSACSGFPSWSSRSPIYRGRWRPTGVLQVRSPVVLRAGMVEEWPPSW